MEKDKIGYKINWDTIDNILDFEVNYDEESDTILMQSKNHRPAVAIDHKGEVWFRVDPKNGEIFGIEIEGFKRVFLRKHPELLRDKAAYVRPIADYLRFAGCPA